MNYLIDNFLLVVVSVSTGNRYKPCYAITVGGTGNALPETRESRAITAEVAKTISDSVNSVPVQNLTRGNVIGAIVRRLLW